MFGVGRGKKEQVYSVSKYTSFLRKIYATLGKQDITSSLFATDVDRNARDLSFESIMLLYSDDKENDEHLRKHTSMYGRRHLTHQGKMTAADSQL